MKRIIAFITAALMAVSMAVPAMAAETSEEKGAGAALTPTAPTQEKADYPLVNPEKKGTITVGLYRSNSDGGQETKIPVSGIPLSIYQVAGVENMTNVGYHFVYEDKFSSLENDEKYSLKNRKNEEVTFFDSKKAEGETQAPIEEYIAAIEKVIKDNKIEPSETQTTDVNGKVKFQGERTEQESGADKYEGLKVGIYLIRQTQSVSGYETIKSFLVTIPQKGQDKDGKNILEYDVDASPKVEPVTPSPYNPGPGPNITPAPETPTPTPTEPPLKNGEADPPVQKVIAGDKPTVASTFYFTLTPENKDNPMPEGTVNGKKTISIKGAGRGEFGTIKFEKAGTYKYTVKEEKGSATGYTYDDHSYEIVYTVDENLKVVETIDGKTGETVTITNRYKAPVKSGRSVTYTNPKTPSAPGTTARTTAAPSSTGITRSAVLPQTGQLWWPVWVLMAAGGICVVTGMLRRKKN